MFQFAQYRYLHSELIRLGGATKNNSFKAKLFISPGIKNQMYVMGEQETKENIILYDKI